jgi:hypothetical protein
MNVSRRTIAVAMAGSLFLPALETCCTADDGKTDVRDAFAGIWSTHYQQTWIYLIIQPDRKAVHGLLEQGSHSFGEVPWIPADNGIIVRGYPMFRLWKTDQPDRCKVQMTAVPPELTNATFVKFPPYFYMTRQRDPLPASLAKMEVPKDWFDAAPPADFNKLVGQPRNAVPN